jgi:hypothetical protein
LSKIEESLLLIKKGQKDFSYNGWKFEIGDVQISEIALKCVINEGLKKEWTKNGKRRKTTFGVIESMGLPAVLPPPEEEKSLKTPIGAARAEHAREIMP